MRVVLAVVAAAATAAFGAVVLGEYDLTGVMSVGAAVLFGVAIAEVTTSVAATADDYLAGAAALLAEAARVWSLYIATGHRLDLASPTAWVSVAAGAIAAAVWVRTSARRERRTSPAA